MNEASTTPPPLPLQGVLVADFTRILAGPLCTMILADLGADVIKIERPGTGDDTRTWGPPFVGDDAAYYLSINRNKRSIALDLNDPADGALARAIAIRADVLVENFRPGVMSRYGLGREDLAAENPNLVYCSIPAFADSKDGAVPGYDLLMQAMTGFMSITGDKNGEPMKMGVALLDVVAGLYSVIAILAALRERDATGTGLAVEVGLFETALATLVNQAANHLLGGLVPGRSGNAHPNIVPYQSFTASDGQFVVTAGNDKLFLATCEAIGRPELATDPAYSSNGERVKNRDALIDEMEATFATGTVDHWVTALAESGVPAAPVLTLDRVFALPEAAAMVDDVEDPVRGSLRLVSDPLRGLGGDRSHPKPPPRLDEHGTEIRRWLAGET